MRSEAGLGAREAGCSSSHVVSVPAEPLASRPAPAAETDEGRSQALVPSVPGRPKLQRLRESVWMPVALRAAGILCGMLALAGIGAWSTLQGAGVPLALASASPSASVSTPAAPPPPASAAPPPPASAATTAAAPSAIPAAVPSGIAPDGRVILNLASAEELTRLPRVGAKRAENILALRRKLGRFKQPADLLRVKGIGRKTLQLMIPKLVLDAPKPEAPPAAPAQP